MRHINVVMLLALITVSVTSSYLRGNHHHKNHKHSHTEQEHISQQHESQQRSFIQIEDHQLVRQENNLVVAVQLGDDEFTSDSLSVDQEQVVSSDMLSENDSTLNADDLETYYTESDSEMKQNDQNQITEEATSSLPYDVQFSADALNEAPEQQQQQQQQQEEQIPNLDLPIVEDPTLDFSQETTPLEDPTFSDSMNDQGTDLSLDSQMPEVGSEDSSLQQNEVIEQNQAQDALQTQTQESSGENQVYVSQHFDQSENISQNQSQDNQDIFTTPTVNDAFSSQGQEVQNAIMDEALDSLSQDPNTNAVDINYSFLQYSNYTPIEQSTEDINYNYINNNSDGGYSFIQTATHQNLIYEATPYRPIDTSIMYEPMLNSECFGDCRIILESTLDQQIK